MKRLMHLVLASFALLFSGTACSDTAEGAVGREYFGLHIHRADQGTAWPSVPFGSWRLWDAYVTWANLEPVRGKWDFSRLDRYVAMAKLTQVDLLLPLANTPRWAAARPDEHSGYQPGNASEPANIEDWRQYVRTVGERYKGRIRNYEIWNEPNIKHHFSGSIAKVVELTCEAYQILKSIDPSNRVVSPGASAGAKGHVDYLDRFLNAGGRNCIDVVAHHFYVPRYGPEAMVPIIRAVREVMQRNEVGHLPLWNTETGWWIENGDGTPDHEMVAKGGWRKLEETAEAGAVLQRAFLLARAEGVSRFYWYSWDNRYGLGMTESKTGSAKAMAADWTAIVGKMLGRTVLGCAAQEAVWTCELVDAQSVRSRIVWRDESALTPRVGSSGASRSALRMSAPVSIP